MDITRGVVSQPCLQPRNAWVQCDDCLKWRRIASELADQIDETNCKWYVVARPPRYECADISLFLLVFCYASLKFAAVRRLFSRYFEN